MRNYLTAFDIANNIRLIRTLHRGTVLIVEGDTDSRVYRRFADENSCVVVPAHGKDKAIDALRILEKAGLRGILTVVDSDFWKLDGVKLPSVNLLLTDSHDLETMILYSNALESVLAEFGSKQKIRRIGKPIRDRLLQSALPIGLLRWLSGPTKENLNLKFDGLAVDKFVNKRNLVVDVDTLIREVKLNSRNSGLDETAIKYKVVALQSGGHDIWQVCSGHDLVEILTIGLKYVFGNRKARKLSYELVDSMLRIAYDYSKFRLTQLYQSILAWETINPSFKVLT